MKICFLIDNIHYLGGAQKCTVRLANEFSEKGNEVTIICNNKDQKSNYTEYELSNKVKLEYIKGTDFILKVLFCWTKLFEKINNCTNLLKDKEKFLSFIYYGRNMLGIKRLQEKLDAKKYDYVIGVGPIYSMMLLLLKKNDAKFIGWQHTTGARYFEIKNFLLWHQDCVFKKALSYLDDYVVLTKADSEYIKNRFGINVKVIYNPTSFETNIKEYNETKTILAMGRYHEVKGFDLLIEAFKIFNKNNKGWKLKIVGEGNQRQKLQELINRDSLQTNILLTGKTNDVIKEYKNADFFVLSSRIEGFGMVVIEAMECGLPVISFALPCIKEIITEEDDGVLVESYDVQDMAKAMERLAQNSELRRKIGINAKKRAKEFSIEKIIKKWEEIIK